MFVVEGLTTSASKLCLDNLSFPPLHSMARVQPPVANESHDIYPRMHFKLEIIFT